MALPRSDNSARRLLQALETLIAVGESGTVERAIGAAFEINTDDRRVILRVIADLAEQFETARQDVKKHGNISESLVDRSFDAVREFVQLRTGLDGSWQVLHRKLAQNGTLTGLEFCADALDSVTIGITLEQDQVRSLWEEMKTVEALVIDSGDLPSELRELLLRNVTEFLHVLNLYSLYGNAGIDKALEMLIGTVVRHGDDYQEIRATPEVSALERAASRIDQATRVAKSSGKLLKATDGLADKLSRLLGLG